MQKIATIVSFGVATAFLSYAATQFAGVSASLTQEQAPNQQVAQPIISRRPDPPQSRSSEPAYKAVIRCLSDMDDLLESVHDATSFAAVKPKLLDRAQHHSDEASMQPNQGMERLSKSAAKELEKAVNRHTRALERAIQAVPAVRQFFEKDISAIMNAKSSHRPPHQTPAEDRLPRPARTAATG